jgi:lipopolysaccharide transport system permease protein
MPSASDAFAAEPGMWVIEPRQHGSFAKIRELWSYRYLWWYFGSATVKSLYRGSLLGWLWLLMRVTAPVGLNALVFGDMLDQAQKVDNLPYFLFFLCGTIAWTVFERSLFYITRSVERNKRLVTRVYFPRLILPVSSIAPGLVYLVVLLVVFAITVVVFHQRDGHWYVTMSPRLLVAVAAIVCSLFFAVAVGLWTSVLQARYRDMRYALRYITPFWFVLTPVAYPLAEAPKKYAWLVALNPMASVVEAFKWGTLGDGVLAPVPTTISLVLIVLTMVIGLWFFNRQETASVDKL